MDVMITFRSVTPAQQGERSLRKRGIPCQLGRTPRYLQDQGCGYSLRVHSTDGARAVAQLREDGVAFRKAYLLSQGGSAQELVL